MTKKDIPFRIPDITLKCTFLREKTINNNGIMIGVSITNGKKDQDGQWVNNSQYINGFINNDFIPKYKALGLQNKDKIVLKGSLTFNWEERSIEGSQYPEIIYVKPWLNVSSIVRDESLYYPSEKQSNSSTHNSNIAIPKGEDIGFSNDDIPF